jgi:hypothetical protein
VVVLKIIGFSLIVMAFCVGLLGFMMGGFKFPIERKSKGTHRR